MMTKRARQDGASEEAGYAQYRGVGKADELIGDKSSCGRQLLFCGGTGKILAALPVRRSCSDPALRVFLPILSNWQLRSFASTTGMVGGLLGYLEKRKSSAGSLKGAMEYGVKPQKGRPSCSCCLKVDIVDSLTYGNST
jgi:hypothetical protein